MHRGPLGFTKANFIFVLWTVLIQQAMCERLGPTSATWLTIATHVMAR